jgi:hypothetical protein
MKYRNIVPLGVLALFATSILSAQQNVEVQVPFSFRVGDSIMPAGSYSVDHSRHTSILLIRSTDGKSSATVMTNATQAKDVRTQDQLVFNRYGDEYFLSQVWRSGYSLGRQLVPTHSERELALAARHKGVESASAPAKRR